MLISNITAITGPSDMLKDYLIFESKVNAIKCIYIQVRHNLKKLLLKKKANKKIRTRDHVIADLSANHIEYHALKNNFSIERFEKDYGYDLNLYTYSNNGEIENGSVFIQLKATDNIKKIKKNKFVSFPLEKRDLNTWLCVSSPKNSTV